MEDLSPEIGKITVPSKTIQKMHSRRLALLPKSLSCLSLRTQLKRIDLLLTAHLSLPVGTLFKSPLLFACLSFYPSFYALA